MEDDDGAWAHHDELLHQEREELIMNAEASKAIAEYNETEKGLAELRGKYAGATFDVATTAGNKLARAARQELVLLRGNLERKRKELKAPALEYAKRIDTEAKRITGEIIALESPIDEQIRVDERRREEEREARAQAERERISALQRRVNAIAPRAMDLAMSSSAEVDAAWRSLDELEITEAEYGEFVDQALTAKSETLDRIASFFEVAVARENAATRMQAEREELDRRRAEQDAVEKAAAAERAEVEAAMRAEREAEQAQMRAEREVIRKQQEELADLRRSLEAQKAPTPVDPEPVPAPVVEPAEAADKPTFSPSDDELINAISNAFADLKPDDESVIARLAAFDADAARRRRLRAA